MKEIRIYPTEVYNYGGDVEWGMKGYYVGHVIKEIVVAINTMGNYNPENDTLYVD